MGINPVLRALQGREYLMRRVKPYKKVVTDFLRTPLLSLMSRLLRLSAWRRYLDINLEQRPPRVFD